jgi:hypothetical protein
MQIMRRNLIRAAASLALFALLSFVPCVPVREAPVLPPELSHSRPGWASIQDVLGLFGPTVGVSLETRPRSWVVVILLTAVSLWAGSRLAPRAGVDPGE